MPEGEPVVSNTSPLLNLALIDRLDVVRDQFSTVAAPEQVWDELAAGEKGLDALRSLRSDGVLEVVTVPETPLLAEFGRELDRGEAAALAYAVETDADLILLDEREGRQAARRHEIPVTGVIGVLLRAARQGELSLRDELDTLREAGFWISESLYEEVLARMENSE
jgi:predicted nucleic acid-binding protein